MIVQLFCNMGSLEGTIKTITGRKVNLVFCMAFYIYSTVLIVKVAMVTGHDMLKPASI